MSKDLQALLTYAQEAGITPSLLDEVVHEAASELASSSNNAGLAEQLQLLCEAKGIANTLSTLEHLVDDAIAALGDERYVVQHEYDNEPTFVCKGGEHELDKPAAELSADIPIDIRLPLANLIRDRLNYRLLSEKAVEEPA